MHEQDNSDRRILLTNDDGVTAEGLVALKQALSSHWDIAVVAPDREQSATSHALTLDRPLRVRKLEDRTFSVDGTPTDCVMLAVYGDLLERKPDLVVSGINHGPNLGDDVTYSGTVAAAIEGTLLGVPSLAFSLAAWTDLRFDVAAETAIRLIRTAFNENMPKDTLLNVNVPNLPPERIRGLRTTKLGRRTYRDAVVAGVDPRGKPYYWIGAQDPSWTGDAESDFAAIEEGYISLTPLHLDLTNYAALPALRQWKIEG